MAVEQCRQTEDIGIFKLPATKNEEYKKWREEWLGHIVQTQVVNKSFRMHIKEDSVYTCEKHFRPEDIEICK